MSILFKKLFSKKNLLNSMLFSTCIIANAIIPQESSAKSQEKIDIPSVISYRKESCSCCKKWVNNIRDNGLKVVDNIIEDVSAIKKQYQIPNNLKSCHTAQIGKYTIEGHVPFESIKKLFREKPIIYGLAVPGMPLGSPGMETNKVHSHSHKYESYEVFSFSKTGIKKVFAKISHQ